MKIRKAKNRDRDKLIVLMQKADDRKKDWAQKRTASYLKSDHKLILVSEEKGKLVGYIGIKEYEKNKAEKFVNLEDYIWITWVAVLPEFRNKKIASKLLNVSEKYVRNLIKMELFWIVEKN